MKTLAETMDKYKTVRGSDGNIYRPGDELCLVCGNGWFFDRGRFYTCTTCGVDRETYTYEEEIGGVYTHCTIRAVTREGLARGVQAYKERFPHGKFMTVSNTEPKETLTGLWACEMGRRTEQV